MRSAYTPPHYSDAGADSFGQPALVQAAEERARRQATAQHAAALDQQRREAVLSQREAVEAASRAAEARVRRELAEAMRDAEHERAEAQRLRELREDAADQEDRVRRDLRSGRLLAAVEERERAADMDASSTRRAESRLRARLEEEHEAALRHAVAAAEQRVRRELGGAGGGRRAEAAEAEVARLRAELRTQQGKMGELLQGLDDEWQAEQSEVQRSISTLRAHSSTRRPLTSGRPRGRGTSAAAEAAAG